jgi:hypothetical protein
MSQDAIWMQENLDGYPAGLNYSVQGLQQLVNRLKMIRDLETGRSSSPRPGSVQSQGAIVV